MLSAEEILRIWELGQGRPAWHVALLMLSPTCPDWSQQELATLTLGDRNVRLYALHEAMFGPLLPATARCPNCEEQLHLEVDGRDIWDPRASVDPDPSTARMATSYHMTADGFDVEFRLLDSRALAEVAAATDRETAPRALLQNVLIRAKDKDGEVGAENLPDTVVQALGDRISDEDPLSDVRLRLNCDLCEHEWSAMFDIVAFVWTELSARAERLLDDIHVLASAYGWSEQLIMGLSTRRRESYIERVVQ